MIFESHAHYDDTAFDGDREELLASLKEHGIGTVINVGASLAGCRMTEELMERYPFVYGAMGVHPSETAQLDEENFRWLRSLCSLDKTVAVGEIGLDYHWLDPEPAVQKVWFERQLELAREIELPVIIHSREAAKDTLDMMQALRAGEIGGVIHCYSYTKEMAREYLNMGFYFGIGGVITFQNAKKLKEAVEYIPMDRILLETDSPYLAPEPNRGKRNSSLNLPYIAQTIARLKGITYDEVVEMTDANARNLFRL
ncbi:MAG: TatD family hydrolase [Lachnospiraceae bacterium]|nr:TatD family hydrolase [Lachnospiraceae bacterium]